MTGNPFDLPPFELAYPGPLRDQLVAAVLSGAKTSMSSLLDEYTGEDDPLPVAGQRYVLVDSDVRAVGLVEVTEVRTLPLNEVDLDFAREEGEGYESVAAWRRAHERFWKINGPGDHARRLHGRRRRTVPPRRASVIRAVRCAVGGEHLLPG
jgi:uncharacterized protein YhfF